ncbi:hypothetical protein A2U01_0090391 [Trifolium medium]|uniref:Uncharacterized protein n=1 Tax=Trifolium medium TaxID=97028 RepID=A0A392U9K4_9FABA|nr:hypothetical protein [Trifolium medium]
MVTASILHCSNDVQLCQPLPPCCRKSLNIYHPCSNKRIKTLHRIVLSSSTSGTVVVTPPSNRKFPRHYCR